MTKTDGHFIKECDTETDNSYTLSDLYLTLVSMGLTNIFVKASLLQILYTFNMNMYTDLVWVPAILTSIIAAKNCLSKQNSSYKLRVSNSITSAVQTVFVSPFTVVAHFPWCNHNFKITKHCFD